MTFYDNFDAAPTYEDKASANPIQVRFGTTVYEAMYWPGTPEKASPVIDWVLLHGGTAKWSEPYEGFWVDEAQTEWFGGHEEEHLRFGTTDEFGAPTTFIIPAEHWILRSPEGEFMYTDAANFSRHFTHL
jgi:hypothetical protein